MNIESSISTTEGARFRYFLQLKYKSLIFVQMLKLTYIQPFFETFTMKEMATGG